MVGGVDKCYWDGDCPHLCCVKFQCVSAYECSDQRTASRNIYDQCIMDDDCASGCCRQDGIWVCDSESYCKDEIRTYEAYIIIGLLLVALFLLVFWSVRACLKKNAENKLRMVERSARHEKFSPAQSPRPSSMALSDNTAG